MNYDSIPPFLSLGFSYCWSVPNSQIGAKEEVRKVMHLRRKITIRLISLFKNTHDCIDHKKDVFKTCEFQCYLTKWNSLSHGTHTLSWIYMAANMIFVRYISSNKIPSDMGPMHVMNIHGSVDDKWDVC